VKVTPQRSAAVLAALALSLAEPALAVIPAAPPIPAPDPSAEAAPSRPCAETFPAGSTRPRVVERFPDRGKSGYALPLEVTIVHGKAETVLTGNLGSEGSPEQLRALEEAGFYLPNAKSASAPRLETTVNGEEATSKLTISVVTLPKKPGRKELTLPSLPVAIARASGEVRTLCTTPHAITVEDPIANTPDASPKPNPKPLPQLEGWEAARRALVKFVDATWKLALALALGALLFWLYTVWRKRRPLPPPPPPRPPWEVALEELFDVRIAQLVEQGRFAEHFDRVSDAVRRYLGARYGFDGLEMTTHESMSKLARIIPGTPVLRDIQQFLENADLVKFAKMTPTESECHDALSRAEDIVRRTVPAPELGIQVPPGAVLIGPHTTAAAPSPTQGSLDAKTGLPPGPKDGGTP
jgi:hypothetical protein